MSSEQTYSVDIDADVWQAVEHQAQLFGDEPRQWINQQLAALCSGQRPIPPSTSLLDLARMHFARLGLSADERVEFGEAIRSVVETGDPWRIGPLAASGRCYRIERRVRAIAITVGEGRIELPIGDAIALADLLSTGTSHIVSLRARLDRAGIGSRDPLMA